VNATSGTFIIHKLNSFFSYQSPKSAINRGRLDTGTWKLRARFTVVGS